MKPPICSEPLPFETLLGYWQGELAEAEKLEEHYLACASCAGRLEALHALGAGVAELVRSGRLLGFTTVAALERAAAEGAHMGTYRLAPGQSVHCTIRPENDFNVLRLSAEFEDARRVDVDLVTVEAGREIRHERIEDVPVDRARNELVLIYPGDLLRELPEYTLHVEVTAPEGEARRSLGRVTMFHSPWPP
jgi:hypothetical protein